MAPALNGNNGTFKKDNNVLELTDTGCRKHNCRQLTFNGSEAELIKVILYNLPRNGDCRTIICEHGLTHYLRFKIHGNGTNQILGF